MYQNFSEYFKLNVSKEYLDFFDINVTKDIERFVDPFYISKVKTEHCIYMNKMLNVFMYELLELIRKGKLEQARQYCKFLSEPNGTRLGYSKIRKDGSGAGENLIKNFVEALSSSKAVTNGTVNHIEELSFVCEGIGKDRISDITIDIIKHGLILFTQSQCKKLGIPTQRTAKKIRYYCIERKRWEEDFFELPHVIVNSKKDFIILMPKSIVPEQVTYNHRYFYTNVAMDYFRAEAIKLNLPAVRKLKNGRVKVIAKILRLDPKYCGHKPNMEKLINKHPESLELFRRIFSRKVQEGLLV